MANLLLARARRGSASSPRRALGSSRSRPATPPHREPHARRARRDCRCRLTVWLLEALLALVPAGLPRLQEVAIDGQVLAFTAVTTVATALIFGTLPALQFSKTDVNESLKEGGRGSAAGARGFVRSALVVVEFALALVLLVGAALLVRSFWRLQQVDLGFSPHHVLTARLWLPQPNDPKTGPYFTHPPRLAAYEEILRRARTLPGVSAAAAVGVLPFDGRSGNAPFTVEGSESDDRSRIPTTQSTMASTGYFELMGIRVLRGRTFTDQDNDKAPAVVVITDALARRGWPGQDPVGRRLHFGGPGEGPLMTVTGRE
jgi:putative ABC transport system permease protein